MRIHLCRKSLDINTNGFILLGVFASCIYIAYTLLNMAKNLKDAHIDDLQLKVNDRILTFQNNETTALSIDIGTNLGKDFRPIVSQISTSKALYNWPGITTLEITKRAPKRFVSDEIQLRCYDVTWKPVSKDFVAEDAVQLSNAYWYGGAEMFEQHWPINKQQQRLQPYVTNVSMFLMMGM